MGTIVNPEFIVLVSEIHMGSLKEPKEQPNFDVMPNINSPKFHFGSKLI